MNRPDAVIIPGSKNTLGDLEYLGRSGLAERIAALARQGTTEIVGICGGLQMLGREIRDPLGIESAAETSRGLGLLEASTVMAAEKTLVRTTARHVVSGLEVAGYEIHHGQTDYAGCTPLVVRGDGQVVGIAGDGQRVWGTYLHGVFDADAFRRWFIDRLRVRRGLAAVGTVAGSLRHRAGPGSPGRSGPRERADGRDLSAHGIAMRLEYQILIAVAIDLLLGDPRWLPHPVRGIGRLAWGWSRWHAARWAERELAGLATAIATYALAGGAAWGAIRLAAAVHPLAGDVVSILVIYTTIAARDLARHSMAVLRLLGPATWSKPAAAWARSSAAIPIGSTKPA